MKFNYTHVYPLKVQFEDVDGGGVVHHPKYLFYLERARCEAMTLGQTSYADMLRAGLAYVVAEMHLRYVRAAQLEQRLFVLSRITAIRRSSIKVAQAIVAREPTQDELARAGARLELLPELLFAAQLRLVCVKLDGGRPEEIPATLRADMDLPPEDEFTAQPHLRDVRLEVASPESGGAPRTDVKT